MLKRHQKSFKSKKIHIIFLNKFIILRCTNIEMKDYEVHKGNTYTSI